MLKITSCERESDLNIGFESYNKAFVYRRG